MPASSKRLKSTAGVGFRLPETGYRRRATARLLISAYSETGVARSTSRIHARRFGARAAAPTPGMDADARRNEAKRIGTPIGDRGGIIGARQQPSSNCERRRLTARNG